MAEEEQVSVEEPAKEEVTEPQEQPLTEERVKELIAATRTEALELGRREGQSTKDKEVAAERRRAQQAEENLQVLRSRFQELEPDAAQALEAEELKGRVRTYEQREAAEAQQRQVAEFDTVFHRNMGQFLDGLGIDTKDKRLDWGIDASDYLTRQQRILASVAKIQKDEKKSLEDRLSQRIKDEVLQARKDAGLESVDTSGPSGVPGLTSLTTEALEKRMNAPDGLEWFRKNEATIDKLAREGKIKE